MGLRNSGRRVAKTAEEILLVNAREMKVRLRERVHSTQVCV